MFQMTMGQICIAGFGVNLREKENSEDQTDCQTKIKLYDCRYIDEIFVAVSGSRDEKI